MLMHEGNNSYEVSRHMIGYLNNFCWPFSGVVANDDGELLRMKAFRIVLETFTVKASPPNVANYRSIFFDKRRKHSLDFVFVCRRVDQPSAVLPP